MKNLKRLACIVLALALCVTAFAACGGDKPSSSTPANNSSTPAESDNGSSAVAEPTAKLDVTNIAEPMDLTVTIQRGHTVADSRVQKWLEDRYNVKFDLIVLGSGSDIKQRVNAAMMAGDDMPDVLWWSDMENEFLQWKDAEMLVDVSEYVNKYTEIRDYQNSQFLETLFYCTEEDGKMYRMPGDVSEPCCQTLWVRKDWLDNLKLEVPKTLDELTEVVRAFTEDDPDGNGQKDTYGLGSGGSNNFRFCIPWMYNYPLTHFNKWVVDDAGKVYYGPVVDETRLWLQDVHDMFEKGWITPNTINTEIDRTEEFTKGYYGVCYGWCAWNNPNTTFQSLQASQPEANWIPLEMVTGKDGTKLQDDPDTVNAWCYWGITSHCPDPERTYAIFDDMCSPEVYKERRYGVEGQEYTIDENGQYQAIVQPGDETDTEQNIGLRLFDGFVNRKDDCLLSNTPETRALFKQSGDNSRDRYAHQIEWRNPSDLVKWTEIQADVQDAVNEYFWAVVSAQDTVDDARWEQFKAELDGLGLQEAIAEAQTVYDAQSALMETYMNNKTNQG